ncbi:MAG: site-specific integrase, partial [Candidatus Thermoplasmatota archaeon]|nr:site-specific integrase [Candidatus Thermoplasmatota archaeon]
MSVSDFILIQKTKGTRGQYSFILGKYFNLIEKSPEGYEKTPVEEIQQDLILFYSKINHLAPKSVYLRMSALFQYLRFHDITISPNIERTIKSKLSSKRTVSMKETLTKSQLKQLLQHATLRERALFLFLASSGMRINEVLHIKAENIDFEFEPTKIDIPANITKGNYPRVTFITDEASEILRQWIAYMPKYKKSISTYNFTRKSNSDKIDEGRVFPFGYNRTVKLWNDLLRKAGFHKRDATTGRSTTTLHSLRRYFMNQARQSMPKDIVDLMVGHVTDLDRAYLQPTLEELSSRYREAEPDISLEGGVSRQAIQQLEEEIKRRDKKLED